MWRWLLAIFLVLHGLVHAAVWATPKGVDPPPFDPNRSWLLGGLGLGDGATRPFSILLALTATVAFVVGIGLLAEQGWWRPGVVLAAAVSLVLITLYFNPWLVVGWGIEVAILAALLLGDWPSEDLVGA
jgi:hypothetical protein